MLLFSNPLDTIGLDISDHIIRAVYMQHRFRKYIVKKFAAVPLEDEIIVNGSIQNQQEVIAAVKKLLSQGFPTKNATAVIGLPESHGFIKTVFVEDEALLEKEIQRHLPFPYNEVTIDCIDHGTIENEKPLHIFDFAAIRTEIATTYTTVLQSCGLHIRALEIESQAIARLFAGDSNKSRAVILGDIGRNHTTFVVAHNERIEFTHTSSLISGKTLTNDIMKKLNLSYEEAEMKKINEQNQPDIQNVMQQYTTALANELKRVIAFHQEHTIIGTAKEYIIYLIGNGSAIANLRPYLEESIRYPIQQGRIPKNITYPSALQSQLLSFGTAIGLARRDF